MTLGLKTEVGNENFTNAPVADVCMLVSAAAQQGGQETTIAPFHTTLLHHGVVILGLPYSNPELTDHFAALGGKP